MVRWRIKYYSNKSIFCHIVQETRQWHRCESRHQVTIKILSFISFALIYGVHNTAATGNRTWYGKSRPKRVYMLNSVDQSIQFFFPTQWYRAKLPLDTLIKGVTKQMWDLNARLGQCSSFKRSFPSREFKCALKGWPEKVGNPVCQSCHICSTLLLSVAGLSQLCMCPPGVRH